MSAQNGNGARPGKLKRAAAIFAVIGFACVIFTYIGVNTGNLVVDSFVGNYTNVAESNSIRCLDMDKHIRCLSLLYLCLITVPFYFH